MLRRWRWLLCIVCLLASVTGHAQRSVDIDGSEDALLLSPHALILEDRDGKLDLDAVRATTSGWQPGRADALVFGFSRSIWWVHFRLHNATQRRLFSTLDLGNPRQDYVTWHLVRNGVATFTSNESGDRVPLSNRALPLRALITPLITKPDETVDVYVRLRSEDGLFEAMPLRISGTSEFVQSSEREELLFTLYAGGLIFLWVERHATVRKTAEQTGWKDALVIGLAQSLALVPGVSRSGSTIVAGMLLGLSRADAARFTFLLSIPIITLAGGKKLLDVITGDAGDVQLDLVLVGMVTAGIVGYFTVKYLLQYLAHHPLDVFAYYRFALAGVILMVIAF